MTHAPIRVITVEREYGSGGGEFAHELATRLGWRLLDSELPCAAARAAGVSAELAAKYDERLDPWYYRYGKVFWQDPAYPAPGLTDEHVFDSERLLSLIQKQILASANEGNCVLVGRGSACALAGKPGCFHVFVYATATAKREWFSRTFPKQAQQADQLLAAFDKPRPLSSAAQLSYRNLRHDRRHPGRNRSHGGCAGAGCRVGRPILSENSVFQ
jgi:hypothetical protein